MTKNDEEDDVEDKNDEGTYVGTHVPEFDLIHSPHTCCVCERYKLVG